mmetsp:Transcript_16271/g.41594  ORF Transcript_16271/g.41594 Transcript_16271/m.41594 type:complete len:872 (+) Transcript_16271:63-2678(+)
MLHNAAPRDRSACQRSRCRELSPRRQDGSAWWCALVGKRLEVLEGSVGRRGAAVARGLRHKGRRLVAEHVEVEVLEPGVRLDVFCAPLGAQALLRVLYQELRDEVPALRADRGLCGQVEGHAQHVLKGLIAALPAEGGHAVQQLVGQDAERPPVHLRAMPGTVDDLGREVLLGAHERVGLGAGLRQQDVVFVGLLSLGRVARASGRRLHRRDGLLHLGLSHALAKGQVKIGEHDVAAAMEQDVLRLEVAVDVAQEVQVLQGQQHLCDVEADVRLPEALLRLRVKEAVELATGADLEDEVQVAWRVQGAVQGGQERVVHRRQDGLLSLHAPNLVALDHLLLVQGLHGKLVVGAGQRDKVHQANVAAAKLLLPLETVDVQRAVLLHGGAQRNHRGAVRHMRLLVQHAGDDGLPGVLVLAAHAQVLQGAADDGAGVVALGFQLGVVLHLRDGVGRGARVGGRHVDLHADHEAAGAIHVLDGRQGEHVPKRFAALLVVEDAHGDLLLVDDRLADGGDRVGVGLGALQEAAVLAEHLLAGVLRQLQKRVRREDYGHVGQRGVADAEVLLDALHRRRQVERHTGKGLGRRRALAVALHRLHGVHHLRHDVLCHVLPQAPVILQQRRAAGLRKRLALRAARHVHLDAHKLGDLPRRRLHRGHGQQVPEGRAVLAVVQQAHGADLARLDRVPDLLDLLRAGALALQEPAIVPQHLVFRVSRHRVKRLAGEDQWAVGEGGIGHDEGVLQAGQHRGEVVRRRRHLVGGHRVYAAYLPKPRLQLRATPGDGLGGQPPQAGAGSRARDVLRTLDTAPYVRRIASPPAPPAMLSRFVFAPGTGITPRAEAGWLRMPPAATRTSRHATAGGRPLRRRFQHLHVIF